jgi:lipid II:glycine glycyltransferase (peptidoglycan interpeptide bridge formation enzyme)
MPQAPPDWDECQAARQASFLQSSLWGSFQQSLGNTPYYLMEDGWSCMLLVKKTPLGTYLTAPYGPTLDSPELNDNAIKRLKQFGRQHGADWLRVEPMLAGASSASLQTKLSKLGAIRAAHNREPNLTRLIDLKPPAEEILASISQSTRSFIRKNQREKFLTFTSSTDPADVEIFTRMLNTVTKRNKVRFFQDDYFKKEAKVLMPSGMMVLELAMQKNKPVAGALFMDFGPVTSYTYAASLPEARQTSASALLLWNAMLNAKRRGLRTMDLFGIAPDEAGSNHPWRGFTSFKKKFGGEVVEFSGTWDIPLSKKYKLYRSAQTARKLLRRH